MPTKDLNHVEEETTEETSDSSGEDKGMPEMSIDKYNEMTGKSYKSWDDVAKSEKERDKFFSEQGNKNDEASKPTAPADITEEVMGIKHPEFVHVKDELDKIAENEKIDILTAYRKYSYLQKEAKALAEEAKEKEKSANSISAPSSRIQSNRDFSNVKDEDIEKMSPQEFEKYSEFMAKGN